MGISVTNKPENFLHEIVKQANVTLGVWIGFALDISHVNI